MSGEVLHSTQYTPSSEIAIEDWVRAVARKVLIHINNTNPILDEDSPERAELARRKVEVAYDGMSIVL